jgi:AcrR family transcriptional regulator
MVLEVKTQRGKRKPAREAAERLGPESWVRAGFEALVRGGAEAVRVEPLAVQLGVTKGSFYWHFADRGELLRQMLARWEAGGTHRIIEQLRGSAAPAREQLSQLMAICRERANGSIEGAVRAWGAASPEAGKVVARVDQAREGFVEGLLREMGLSAASARQRTRVLYLALLGEFARTASGAEPTSTEVWEELLTLLTSR